MAKNLVIVESPAKAKTIEKFLGKDFKVEASVGHVRDLSKGGGKGGRLGVDIENNFAPTYVETERGKDVLKNLKKQVLKSETVYLCPDPDREGEAIAWHLKEALAVGKAAKTPFKRVTFNQITKSAVTEAFKVPGEINMNVVNSQQARRILDRLVGFQVSPLLWSNVQKGTSAGRVQTVALRLVCEKEREILAFKPVEYWNFFANLDADEKNSGKSFSAKLAKINGKKYEIDNEKDATCALKAIQGANGWDIDSVEVKPRKKNPVPPFITSSLQQVASSRLGMGATNTMRVAQQLYEGIDLGSRGHVGLITYMRTDSFSIAKEAQFDCLNFIENNYGKDYKPAKPNFYKSKSGAQGAHEAIRPSDVNITPKSLKGILDAQQLKLYTIIWQRFVASQMAPAKQQRTTVEVLANGADKKGYLFRTSVTVTLFPGFMKVYKDTSEEEQEVPAAFATIKKGTPCYLKEATNEQKFTEPPARFSEASLIKELEANGVGRPSTYASIINTIQQREYVKRDKGRLSPFPLGFSVNDFCVASLPDLFQVKFTAEMEEKLDEIEEGKIDWTDMLKRFYDGFGNWLNAAKTEGAPEKTKATELIKLLENITQWKAAEKKGARAYSDEKFFNSVKNKFEKDGVITKKQWENSLRIAIGYKEQLPFLEDVAKQFSFDDDLEEAKKQVIELDKKFAQTRISDKETANFAKVFEAFDKVKEWAEPVTRGKRVYDDKDFVASLRSQVESGKKLTEKQVQALGRNIDKYNKQLEDHKGLAKSLNITLASAEFVANPAVEKDINFLSTIKEWAEPTKKGRRVYDDKDFYDSIKGQYESGRTLSPRQIAAFGKLASKYRSSGGKAPASEGGEKIEPAEVDPEILKLLETLSKVKEWDAPTKKGKRTFSDEAFYKSLDKQAKSGKVLSVKQVAALKKIVEKYNK